MRIAPRAVPSSKEPRLPSVNSVASVASAVRIAAAASAANAAMKTMLLKALLPMTVLAGDHCHSGKYVQANYDCKVCPAGSYTPPFKSSYEQDCCTPCEDNTYKNTASFGGADARCTPCPAGSKTLSRGSFGCVNADGSLATPKFRELIESYNKVNYDGAVCSKAARSRHGTASFYASEASQGVEFTLVLPPASGQTTPAQATAPDPEPAPPKELAPVPVPVKEMSADGHHGHHHIPAEPPGLAPASNTKPGTSTEIENDATRNVGTTQETASGGSSSKASIAYSAGVSSAVLLVSFLI